MSANPIDKNSTPKATGSLEELFRHHLGEEAAVPPRPMLWDQIDNSLLIRQNEVYRKRLAATRWVAAASLLLATLAGTGWWAGRDGHLLSNPATMAVNYPAKPAITSPSGDGRTPAGSASTRRNAAAGRTAAIKATAATADAAGPQGATIPGSYAATSGTTVAGHNTRAVSPNTAKQGSPSPTAGRTYDLAARGTAERTGFGRATRWAQPSLTAGATDQLAANSSRAAQPRAAQSVGTVDGERNNDATTLQEATSGAAASTAAAVASSSFPADNATVGSIETAEPTTAATASVAAAEAEELLAARLAALRLMAPATLPNGLAALALPTEASAKTDFHRWHYSASYTAGVFNPNINFSRAGIEHEHDYNPALGPDSPKLTEAAATEYRENLRPGLSQRIALLASRHLGGHWSLSTGAEFTQATAQSASSSTFVGEQLIDLGLPHSGPLHTTDFRYQMASVPVELRYTNPVKHGWSLYGRLGGVVTALLGVRSDVEGSPEAARTYSIASAGTPYRRVLGSLRAGAGTQFRTNSGKWAFTLGPVAEIGLTALNAHPVQSYFAQSHPYSFGLEAGVEFGR